MERGDGVRRCHCGTRLARDNRGSLCWACQKKVAWSKRTRPPTVPTEFWQTNAMQAALASRDMGQVMRAFRQHPFHAGDIPQSVAAGWVGVSQSRLSRIENGEPLTDLAKLTRWARVLGLPPELCWFHGPGPRGPTAALPDLARSEMFELTGSVLLPVVIDGHPVLVPLNTATMPPLEDVPQLGTLVTRMSEWDGMSPMERRTLLGRGLTVAALSALGLDELEQVALALTNAGKYLDASVVGYFRRQLAACAADDGDLGPQKTLPTVLGVIRAVEQHARAVSHLSGASCCKSEPKAPSSRAGSTATPAT